MSEVATEETVSLYRKYRPSKFSDVIGQTPITEGLRKSVASGKVLHAYLFSGERGCGKTTTARIFAAALNCADQVDGEPCGVCDDCVSIHNGGHSGLVNEINSANARGVNDMRALLESVNLGVGNDRYKVYILDEVHQLTYDAANAMLKTLEEPENSHVIFILATTDPDKVIQTIRSRVMHMEFKLIPNQQLEGMASGINEKEGLNLSEKEIKNSVATGRGSARDTISAMERAALGIHNEESDARERVLTGVANKDLSEVLVAIAEAGDTLNARQAAEDVMALYRDAMLYQQNPTLLTMRPDSDLVIVKTLSNETQVRLVKGFQTISQTLLTMKQAGNNRVVLEGGLAMLMVPGARQQLDGVLDMLEDLQDQVGQIQATISSGPFDNTKAPVNPEEWPAPQDKDIEQDPEPDYEPEPKRTRKPSSVEDSEPETPTPVTQPVEEPAPIHVEDDGGSYLSVKETEPETVDEGDDGGLERIWNTLIEESKPRTQKLLEESDFSVEDGYVVIVSPRRINDRVRDTITDVFSDNECEFSEKD